MKLTSANLLNGDKITFGDFNVFIGGNGVGKTTIISEIFHKASELARNKYWWIDQIEHTSDDLSKDLGLLKSSMARRKDGINWFYFSNAVKNIEGNVDLGDEIRFSPDEIKELESKTDIALLNERKYRRPFISFSSCESRLGLQNEAGLARLDQPPSDPLNVLDRNRALLKEIDKNIFEIFKYHFVLLSHVGTALQIGISKEVPPVFNVNADFKQDEFEKIETWKKDNFTPITEAGHGIRSMIRLLTSLLEPVNQIILIDEPEMHLYPSQKRWLGRQLVSLAAKQKKQVFLVTHDPMVLQGILDENTKTNIFRVDRDEKGKGTIKYCEFDKVEVTHSRNQEQYLQGLFYQRCLVVEGASDRSFYQQMLEDYQETQNKDLGVVVAGSVSHSKHMVDIAAKVGLKAAFIYDLDVLFQNQSLIKDIFTILGGQGNPIEKLEEAFESDEKVKNAIGDKKGPEIKRATGFTRKTGFGEAWATKNMDVITQALDNLAKVGIFVVPNGTLENWAPAVEETARFAEQAPEAVKSTQELKDKFDKFMKKVLSYLEIEFAA